MPKNSPKILKSTSDRGSISSEDAAGEYSTGRSSQGSISDIEDSLPDIQDIPRATAVLNEDTVEINDYLGESPHPLGCHSELPLTLVNSQTSSSSYIRVASANVLTRKYVRVLEAAALEDSDFHADNAACTEKVLRELLQMSAESARQVVKIIARGLSQ